MIIKELELRNIRSHGHSLIRFPLGRTLLEGDIGSGKSSVLMAIEFVLFGLGSDSGSSVLKLGQDSGEARMVFDVDGSEYEVTRRLLRKSGRVQQADGTLKTPGETLVLSPSELKEKVLEVLEFNEAPDPKAQSWIYRYAVYTPQEEMKDILALAPEQRLQILRRALRVEDYKAAATNADDAGRQIREDAREQDGIARGMDELRGQAERLRAEEERHGAVLAEFEGKETKAAAEVESVKKEMEGLQKRELTLQGAKAEKEYYERLGSDALEEAASSRKEIAELQKELAEVEGVLGKAEAERPPAAGSLPELKRRGRALEAKAKKLTELKAAAETKLSDYESIMKNGVCPVCDRPADARDFEAKMARKDAERKHFAHELESVEGEIETTRQRIDRAEAHLEGARELAHHRAERSRLKTGIGDREQAKRKFDKRAAFAKAALEQTGKRLEELEDLSEEIGAVNRKLARSEESLRAVRDTLVRTRGCSSRCRRGRQRSPLKSWRRRKRRAGEEG